MKQPICHQSPGTLTLWWEEDPDQLWAWADAVNDRVTVFRSLTDNRPLGVRVAGLRLAVGP